MITAPKMIALALCLAPTWGPAATPRITPLEARAYVRVSSHEELLGFLQKLAADSPRLVIETIGTTVQGRPIPMVHVLPQGAGARLRVLVFCQQHGNEPSGKEAALHLLSRIAGGQEETLGALDLYLVPSVNPDGNEAAKRQNAHGADLNRDHLLLSQPETRVLHDLFQRVQPEVTLDVHEYGPFGKAWTSTGWVRAMDEQYGAPTNLNVPPQLLSFAKERLFPHLKAELGKQGLRFFEYVLADSPEDTARRSTTSINDGRQSFAIQGSLSFILEGRNGRLFNDDLKRRTASASGVTGSRYGSGNSGAPSLASRSSSSSQPMISRLSW